MLCQKDSGDSFRISVLVVDDNAFFLKATADFLVRHQELVVGTVCGRENVIAQAQSVKAHVILVGLNGIGLEMITHLRQALPSIGIIALTLAEGDAYRQAVVAAGADDIVCKAELVIDLLPAIWRVMQAGRSR
jgi:DNA-binding NarL/FixJ family response regulator